MALDFPSSPVVGQTYNNYTWTGVAWEAGYTPVVPNLQLATYANAAARDAAITAPTVGMQAYLTDIKQVTTYNGSIWKSDMAGLVPMVPATVRVSGGTATANSLGTVSFTGTSLGIDGAFTTAYSNYRVVLNWGKTTVSDNVFMRFTTNGTNMGSAAQYGALTYKSAATTSASNNVNFYHIGSVAPSLTTQLYGFMTLDISTPMTANLTSLVGTGFSADSGAWESRFIGGTYNSTNLFDGLVIYLAGGGSFSGSVTVYGYNS